MIQCELSFDKIEFSQQIFRYMVRNGLSFGRRSIDFLLLFSNCVLRLFEK